MRDNLYSVGGKIFGIQGERLAASVKDMPGFDTFLTPASDDIDFFFAEEEKEPATAQLKTLYTFKSDSVCSAFSSYEEGHILDMHTDRNERLRLYSRKKENIIRIQGCFHPRLLRFALWVGYSLMTLNDGRIAIHGSCIVNKGKAFLFLGESGTGKSTHTRLWREFIPGSFLLNDDSPIVVARKEEVRIYGSPWSGKTPCYRQESYPLCGCVRLSQAPCNKMDRLTVFQAYAALHPSCPPEFAYDEQLYNGIGNSLDLILSRVPVYHLDCLPDRAAAELSSGILNK